MVHKKLLFCFGLSANAVTKNSNRIYVVNISNITDVFSHSRGPLAVGNQKVKYIHIIFKRYYITGYCVQYQYIYIPSKLFLCMESI